MGPNELNYDKLLERLDDAEELIHALLGSQTDAVVSPSGVHVLRLHEADQALQAARKGLEEMLALRTRELRASNEKLRKFYDSPMMGVYSWKADGGITDANDEFLRMTGYSREDLGTGVLNWRKLTPAEYRRSDEESLQRLTKSGVDSPYEKEYIRKDGSRFHVLLSSARIQEDGETGMSIAIDISSRKGAEQALIKSEKLASVGRMAATVAHEINNPLELVLNCVYIASLDKNLSAQARENLATAEQELNRVAQLTRQTLGFYRESSAPTAVGLGRAVDEVLEFYRPKLVQRAIHSDHEARTRIEIRGVPGEIRQIISNLLSNAIEASPRGGRIRIRTSCIPFDSVTWVRLTVADTGQGIPRENLSHIFEPFFTTKESVGTGLGLWVTGEIVRRHNGKLRVRSRAGRGSVFSVMFPVAHKAGRCNEVEGFQIVQENPSSRR
jgi:PAS domain S-box-containing protein